MNILRRHVILSGCVIALGLATATVMAQSRQRTSLHGQLPSVVPRLTPLGRLDGAARLKLSINLPLRNQQALTNLLQQLYDPASPLYHHYLSPEEFTTQFGPTKEDYQAVISWAARNGFTVTEPHSNRMLLKIDASVADVERALQVTMRTYAHPTEDRTFFSPDTEPTVDGGVPILNIGGLDNFARPHPKILRHAPLKVSAEAKPQNIGSGPNGNLAGFDYRAAYVPGVSLTGAGQMIGLLEFDGYYAGDISSYETLAGAPNVPLRSVLLDGFDGKPTGGPDSGNTEVALDIEMAISMAPGLSDVVVFEAGPNGIANDVLDAMSTNTSIKQFSSSWGFGPVTTAQRTVMDNYFMELGAQGQSFFEASGDGGAATNGTAIPPPDDDPYITVVGGTTLATAGAGDPWLSETVWNTKEGPGAYLSAGGVSTIYDIPSWQKGVNMSANGGSTTKRNFPDVAMVADNIFIVADDGQEEASGGTSAAAPLWAGLTALANQQAAAAGLQPVGFLNPALYKIGTSSGYTASFDDIVVGNNTNNDPAHYLAVPGYDLCTGWGSPSGGSLIIALTEPDGLQITPGRGAVANGMVGGPFTVSTQTLSLINTGMTAFNWSLGASASWMNVSTNNGTLAPGGEASVSLALNSAANLLPAGVYTSQLWFTNLSSGLAQLRQFTLQVGQELVEDGGFEAGDFCYWTLSGPSSVYTNNFVDDGTGTGYSAYAGNYFAAFGQPSNLCYLSQSLPTLAGQYYQVSFWLENPLENSDSSSNPNQFLVRWGTNAASEKVLFNQTNMSAFGWSNLQFMVQASSNVTALQFGFRNDNDFFCLDNVSVTAVPAPPSQEGALLVTISPAGAVTAGAQWQLDGGINEDSGVKLANISTGAHTVSFTPVSGWVAPSDQTVTITSGATTTASGVYTTTDTSAAELTLLTNGDGTIQHGVWPKSLVIGNKYTVTAAAKAGNVFSNWVASGSQSFVSNHASLTFTMSDGLALEANFVTNVFLAAKGAYRGLFAATNFDRQQAASGSVSLNVTSSGAISGSLDLGGQMVSLTGKFDLGGLAEIASKPVNRIPALTTTLQLDFADHSVSGTVSSGAFIAPLQGYRDGFSSLQAAAEFEGQYTLILPGSTNPAVGPFGASYGTVKVSPSGTVTLMGSLADGTAISQSSVVAQNGYWPLYVNLYGGHGSLWGWNYFSNHTLTAPFALSWINATNPSKTALYRPGFTNQQETLTGGLYVPTNPLPIDFTVTLEGGDLPVVITNNAALSDNDKITVANSSGDGKLTLAITKSTGLISGSWANPDDPKQTIKVNGVILQLPGQTNAQGYFLGTNQSGDFTLDPP